MKLSEPLNTFNDDDFYLVEFRCEYRNVVRMADYFSETDTFHVIDGYHEIPTESIIEVRKVEPNDPK